MPENPFSPSNAQGLQNQSDYRYARSGNLGFGGDLLNGVGFNTSDYDSMFNLLGLGVDDSWNNAGARQAQYAAGANNTRAGQIARLQAAQTAQANQSRLAQAALFQQMQQQVAGPSVSDMQARQAMGGNLQAALAASAGGAGAAPVMNRAAGVAGGVAGDSGVARLAEQMRLQQAAAGQANAVRGADIQTADQVASNARDLRDQNTRMQQLYASLGRQLSESRARQALENYKLRRSLDLQQSGDNLTGSTNLAKGVATAVAA